jgi:hypothetical protein
VTYVNAMAKLMATPCHSFFVTGTLIPLALMIFDGKGQVSLRKPCRELKIYQPD